MRVKHNKVYFYNSSFEYVQTAKSWSEAARISGTSSYQHVYNYLDSGELFQNKWYFFSKELSLEQIVELNATTVAERIPILLANESYQGQDITIYIHVCNNLQKIRLVKVVENTLEAANVLNTSCKIVERYMNTNKLFKTKYLICSKLMRDEEEISDDANNNITKPESSEFECNLQTLPEPESESTSHLPLPLPLPEADFLLSIRRFAANHYTNVYPIPEIFGQMDETALLAISILLQEYIDQTTYT